MALLAAAAWIIPDACHAMLFAKVSAATPFTSAARPVVARKPGARARSECAPLAVAAAVLCCSTRWADGRWRLTSGQRGRRWRWREYVPHFACLAPPPCRYELGRQAAGTKLSSHTAVRKVRVRGGNEKFRALRCDHGNFSWGTEVGDIRKGRRRRRGRQRGDRGCMGELRLLHDRHAVDLCLGAVPARPGSGQAAWRSRGGGRACRNWEDSAEGEGTAMHCMPSADRPLSPLQAVTRKVRIMDVTYNASNNELVGGRSGGGRGWQTTEERNISCAWARQACLQLWERSRQQQVAWSRWHGAGSSEAGMEQARWHGAGTEQVASGAAVAPSPCVRQRGSSERCSDS
jgi:ribosomal protein S8E